MKTYNADQFVEFQLRNFNADLGKHLKGDVIVIKSPIRFGLDDAVRLAIEALFEKDNGDKKQKSKLIIILETTGGYIEVVERLYNVFRHHYKHVEFIIPNYAYSAGTVLALSGDEIYMDYYSVLGPIDPQYEMEDGKFVPGLGYLQKFNELIQKVNADTKNKTKAELAYLLKKFDPATLFHLEQARDHSISLLETWLPKHKFKDWKITEKRKVKVTIADKKQRAKKIGETLSNAERWHSHGRGIGIRELTSNEIKLKIKNFGDDSKLNSLVRQYYDFLLDYGHKVGAKGGIIHTGLGLRRL